MSVCGWARGIDSKKQEKGSKPVAVVAAVVVVVADKKRNDVIRSYRITRLGLRTSSSSSSANVDWWCADWCSRCVVGWLMNRSSLAWQSVTQSRIQLLLSRVLYSESPPAYPAHIPPGKPSPLPNSTLSIMPFQPPPSNSLPSSQPAGFPPRQPLSRYFPSSPYAHL